MLTIDVMLISNNKASKDFKSGQTHGVLMDLVLEFGVARITIWKRLERTTSKKFRDFPDNSTGVGLSNCEIYQFSDDGVICIAAISIHFNSSGCWDQSQFMLSKQHLINSLNGVITTYFPIPFKTCTLEVLGLIIS